jgi:hypothetical protein
LSSVQTLRHRDCRCSAASDSVPMRFRSKPTTPLRPTWLNIFS